MTNTNNFKDNLIKAVLQIDPASLPEDKKQEAFQDAFKFYFDFLVKYFEEKFDEKSLIRLKSLNAENGEEIGKKFPELEKQINQAGEEFLRLLKENDDN